MSTMLHTRKPTTLQERWLLAFVLTPIVCQVALLFERLSSLRFVFRSAPFLSSVALLVLLSGRGAGHPSRRWAIGILLVVLLNVFQPETRSMLVAGAQLAMYAAILAPLFWVSRLQVSPALFSKILLIIWGFHTLSALFGVLQVYYPGQFQPALSSALQADNPISGGLKIRLASGERMWRPMGLTDSPGGAACSGLTAMVFGLGFALHYGQRMIRVLAAASMALGLFCIYLSQVRSILVMAVICATVFTIVLLRRGEIRRFVAVALLVPVVFVISFVWAVSVGGDEVSERFATLVDDSPTTVYYRSRGIFLEHTLKELLPAYPLGAGLGRWGMMNYYFGNRNDPAAQETIYVEIQLTGWLLDGGLPLILLYTGALLTACYVALRIAMRSLNGLEVWGALILAYDMGIVAVTFNYAIFNSQGGLEFWLLNACLYAAAVHGRGRSARGSQPASNRQPLPQHA